MLKGFITGRIKLYYMCLCNAWCGEDLTPDKYNIEIGIVMNRTECMCFYIGCVGEDSCLSGYRLFKHEFFLLAFHQIC